MDEPRPVCHNVAAGMKKCYHAGSAGVVSVSKISDKVSKETAGQDRRKEKRIQEENKVVFSLEPGPDGSEPLESYNALTFDISPGGIRIVSCAAIPLGARIRMDLVLSRIRKVVHVEGTVRWVNRLFGGDLYEAGIGFSKISPEDQLLLLSYAYRREQEI